MIKKLLVFFVTAVCMLSFSVTAFSETDNIIPELIDSLPDNVKNELPEHDGDMSDVGSNITASYLLDSFTSMLGSAFRSSAGAIISLICVIIVSSVVNTVCAGVGNGVKQAGEFICGTGVLVSLFHFLSPFKTLLSEALSGIGLTVKSAVPAITAVCAASGSISSSAVNGLWISALLTLTEQLADSFLSPLIAICFGLLIVSAVSKYTGSPDFSGCLDTVKTTVTVVLALFGTVFTTVMTYQSVIAKSSDSILLKSVKFASGNFIPVVGGALSEAASGYLAGLSVIKSSAGLITAAAILLCIVPVLLRLLFSRVGLDIAAMFASALGCSKDADIIRQSRSILDLCFALCALCGGIFLVVVAIFVKTAVPV